MKCALYFAIILVANTISEASNQVAINPPDQLVSIPGGRATFRCTRSNSGSTHGMEWLINGTRLDDLVLHNVANDHNGEIMVLEISNISHQYNMTTVKCQAGNFNTSDVLLLLQDNLVSVGSLSIIPSGSTLFLNWTAPFTLDITGIDPDITYCVDVVNSTSSSTLVNDSRCGINETEFSYPTPPDTDCHVYNFTVTPVNLVGNGTADTISYMGGEISPRISSLKKLISEPENCYQLNMSAPVCDVEAISFVNLDTEEKFHASVTNITGNIFVACITDGYQHNVTVHVYVSASNSAGSATSNISIIINATTKSRPVGTAIGVGFAAFLILGLTVAIVSPLCHKLKNKGKNQSMNTPAIQQESQPSKDSAMATGKSSSNSIWNRGKRESQISRDVEEHSAPYTCIDTCFNTMSCFSSHHEEGSQVVIPIPPAQEENSIAGDAAKVVCLTPTSPVLGCGSAIICKLGRICNKRLD